MKKISSIIAIFVLVIFVLVIFVLALFLSIHYWRDHHRNVQNQNRDIKAAENFDSHPLQHEGINKEFETLTSAVIKEFEAEFDELQPVSIDFAREKEEREVIKGDFTNVGGICYAEGFQDAFGKERVEDFVDIGFILINPRKWDTLSELEKRQILYHELVHCSLKYEPHVDFDEAPVVENRPSFVTSDGTEALCPVSILVPSAISKEQVDGCMGENIDYYIADIHKRTGR